MRSYENSGKNAEEMGDVWKENRVQGGNLTLMATSTSAGRSRSIRHPQNAYNGAELLSSSSGPTYNGGPQRMTNRPGGPPSQAQSSYGPSASSSNPATNRSSAAEFEDLLYQANYAANHYETQPQSQSQSPPTQYSLGPRQPSQRSKTPDARRARNSLHKPNPNTNYMANSGTPPRPLRTNTSTLNDGYRNDDQRERRLSLPSSNAHNDGDYYQPAFQPDFNQVGTISSTPPVRSRSGTQSNKNKKGMLSFMSGQCQTTPGSPRLLTNRAPSKKSLGPRRSRRSAYHTIQFISCTSVSTLPLASSQECPKNGRPSFRNPASPVKSKRRTHKP